MRVINGLTIKYWIGDIVYLITDVDQKERIVTGVDIRQSGVSYNLSYGSDDSDHYDIEISKEKDVLKTLK
jgi:hypothetical protein